MRTWATWDHYTIHARILDGEQATNFANGKRKKWTGWTQTTDEQTMEMTEKNDDKSDEN